MIVKIYLIINQLANQITLKLDFCIFKHMYFVLF